MEYKSSSMTDVGASLIEDVSSDLKPREKMIEFGVEVLSNDELLAIILGSGCKNKNVYQLSKEISLFLEERSNMPTLDELIKKSGLGPAKSQKILACLELSNRFLLSRKLVSIKKPDLLIPALNHLKNLQQEVFVCVTLSSANTVINIHNITVGLVNSSQIHPREAFSKAIVDSAVAVIFAHNHPSGNLKPSIQDVTITKNLMEVGDIIGISVLDHIIISKNGWLSMKSDGFMSEL